MASQNELRERVPDSVPNDIELFTKGDEVYGRDEYGEFPLAPDMRGSEHPQEGRCGWPVKHTMDRYGETRYCGRLPENKFVDGGSHYCKMHKSAEALMERSRELFEHGYFATNYINFVKKLSAEKFIFAVEIFRGLVEQSEHEFDVAKEVRVLDTSDSELIGDEEVAVELWIPTAEQYQFQANELWTASLKEVMTQNMQEAIFSDGMEKNSVSDSASMDGKITDVKYEPEEHHLHLPVSRLAKDIKAHLENGGVSVDGDESGVVTLQKNDYVLDVGPEESDSAESESVSEVSEQFTKSIQEEANNVENAETE